MALSSSFWSSLTVVALALCWLLIASVLTAAAAMIVPFLVILWLDYGPYNPTLDYIAEGIVQWYDLMVSTILYACFVGSVADILIRTFQKRYLIPFLLRGTDVGKQRRREVVRNAASGRPVHQPGLEIPAPTQVDSHRLGEELAAMTLANCSLQATVTQLWDDIAARNAVISQLRPVAEAVEDVQTRLVDVQQVVLSREADIVRLSQAIEWDMATGSLLQAMVQRLKKDMACRDARISHLEAVAEADSLAQNQTAPSQQAVGWSGAEVERPLAAAQFQAAIEGESQKELERLREELRMKGTQYDLLSKSYHAKLQETNLLTEQVEHMKLQISSCDEENSRLSLMVRAHVIEQKRLEEDLAGLQRQLVALSNEAKNSLPNVHGIEGGCAQRQASVAPQSAPSALRAWKEHPRMIFAVRIKPPKTTVDEASEHAVIVRVNEEDPRCVLMKNPVAGQFEEHLFDQCFSPAHKNINVWQEFEGLIFGFLDGHVVCIVTDGPSSSGKTFSMFKGRDPLIAAAIYNTLQHAKMRGRTLCVRAVEVYRNVHSDLTQKLTDPPQCTTHTTSRTFFWRGCAPLKFDGTCAYETIRQRVMALDVKRARRNTAMNTNPTIRKGASSRSHLVIIVTIDGQEQAANGRLVFVDLAGEERADENEPAAQEEYKEIRLDRAGFYSFMELGNYSDSSREFLKLMKSLLEEEDKLLKIVHFFHLSLTDYNMNKSLLNFKKRIQDVDLVKRALDRQQRKDRERRRAAERALKPSGGSSR